MAAFVQVVDFMGFDGADSNAPWQMVPQGLTREVKLIQGNDQLEFTVTGGSGPPPPPTPAPLGSSSSERRHTAVIEGAKASQDGGAGLAIERKRLSPTDQIVVLRGWRVGSYEVQASDPKTGKPAARLLVDVVKQRTVPIAYYRLLFAEKWDTRVLNEQANRIIFDQAGITLKWLGEFDGAEGSTPITLPPGPVNLENAKTRTELRFFGNNPGAELMVYLTNFGVDDGNGMTLGDQTIIYSRKWKQPSEFPRMVETLAHEIGHFLSNGKNHDGKKDDLMFETSPHGRRIRKDRTMMFVRGL
ncbi:hypothetical protein [Singulisphaera acidiphila]|uniref:Uncharacterized protein n=1 Tax=Singulisphaera acidiphila (strain ATCC BAA-1392 / DSM 18658 / VKM B-2454 / MOB10) TaxID=886293 RepID=L0DGE5_SINAD|nr:hypothetical protein [Singulisphaera acidiphila]AGA28444.1 hypothetical protein Sinac_4243 [Singulisphaera acidiphila DSM 18658]